MATLDQLDSHVFQPLDVNTPIVNREGRPSPSFTQHQQTFRKVLLAQTNESRAAIVQEGEARAEADNANALLVDSVAAEALGFTAAILMKMEVGVNPAGVLVRYQIMGSLVAGGVPVKTGMFFDIVSDGGSGYLGRVHIEASKFSVGVEGSSGVFPFYIEAGIVYIESAVIKNLSVGTGKLAYNAATALVITGQGVLAGPGSPTLQTAGIYNEYGAVSVDVSTFLNRPSADPANTGDLFVAIQRNGVEITRRTMFYDDNFAYPIAFTHVDYPSTGVSHSYTAVCGNLSGLGNWDMKDTVLRLINFKR